MLKKSSASREFNYSHDLVRLRKFKSTDRLSVYNLLYFLPELYPRADHWLCKKLDDVLANKAECTLVESRFGVLGVTIETPKEKGYIKLSTIYVHPVARGQGVGSKLMQSAILRWQCNKIRKSHVTVDLKRVVFLEPLLTRNGFRYSTTSINRYGEERHEAIFNWSI